MLDPTLKPGDPLWWVARLHKALEERNRRLKTYDEYYSGKHRLAFASVKFRTAFGKLFDTFADNWCDLVVDAVEERLNVEGFRFGTDTEADDEAWEIWQRNGLDAESQLAHTEALIKEESYALVWADDDGQPEITIEDPTQVIVAMVPGRRRRRLAALKVWTDDWEGRHLATLYLPDGIYKYRSATRSEWGPSTTSRWAKRIVPDEAWPLPNTLGVVPVIPLVNRPRLLKPGASEIAKVIPVQDGINKLIADMFVASEVAGFRQRWATGMEIPINPETKQPVEPFKAAVDRLWMSEDPDTKFGEFEATDLRNFVVAVEMLVQHVASQTRTPPHYFYLKGEFPSGESIKSAETGLVAKAHRKMRHFGEGWEDTMRLAFAILDDPRANETKAETIWGDPESRTESEHVDAVMKKQSLNVPQEQLWEDLGYTPQQIERFREMLRRQAAEQAAAGLDFAALLNADLPPDPVPIGTGGGA